MCRVKRYLPNNAPKALSMTKKVSFEKKECVIPISLGKNTLPFPIYEGTGV